jgi:CheY-like chemotaxis protein
LKTTGTYAFVLVDAPSDDTSVTPPLAGVRDAPPLVLLTALHQPLNNSKLTQLGAVAQIRRPVREDHLEALLTDLVAGTLTRRDGQLLGSPAGAAARDGARAGTKPRVIVVDDVELNLMVARAMLGSLGMEVTSANGGPDALDQLAADRFDLILMDCHMPEIDGYEVTRRVRASQGPNRDTPIVALSASAFAEDRDRALQSGMNDFAPKPIELNGLRAVLHQWLPGFNPGPHSEAQTSVA